MLLHNCSHLLKTRGKGQGKGGSGGKVKGGVAYCLQRKVVVGGWVGGGWYGGDYREGLDKSDLLNILQNAIAFSSEMSWYI